MYQRPPTNVREIVSNMTGVGETTIYRFLRERKSGVLILLRVGGSKPLEIEEFHKNIIRRQVHSLYFHKEIQKLGKIITLINQNDEVPSISKNKLWKLLSEIGFHWEKYKWKSLLIDRQDIVCWRRDYLRKIKNVPR